ncbi:p115 like vesicle tethering protein [Limtongia smithiae]|uniref:p115 like vesicle tethering protein n=1 Tax=Limtongia smithiae TaxID=1125753 RepID=UPI0034CE0036
MPDLLSSFFLFPHGKSALSSATSAMDTITTLCERLALAIHVEDRRASVLGLKSFCRQYREAVVTRGSRALLHELVRDKLDTETVKVTLETILVLFVRDRAANDSETDYISLWLADAFTQKDETIASVISILENNDLYVRVYTLQLLSAILTLRPERVKQCVLSNPAAVSQIVAIIDDERDNIRTEVLKLLVRLADGNVAIQKLIAFENTFDKIFDIVGHHGGIDGGATVGDYLSLLACLLRYNSSNQTSFRETKCTPRLAALLSAESTSPSNDPLMVRNLTMVLEICRFFVAPDSSQTSANQLVFFNDGIFMSVLRLAFSANSDLQVRAVALLAAGDLLRGNHDIQQTFSSIDVPYIRISTLGDMNHTQTFAETIPVTRGLVDWTLSTSSVHAFDLRAGAQMCLEGYFAHNNLSRTLFLDESTKLYYESALSCPYPPNDRQICEFRVIFDEEVGVRTDPYRMWFACVILLQILEGGQDLKDRARRVKPFGNDGDAGQTAIQKLAMNLVYALQNHLDIRIGVGYIMLLSVWLYEDYDAIDDLLSNEVVVKALIAQISQFSGNDVILEGMCMCLVASFYGFSTTQSPYSRQLLHRLIVSQIGRDAFTARLRLLRAHPTIRNFDSSEMLESVRDESGLPNVLFHRIFVDFFKDRYSRLLKVLDKDPSQDPISPEVIAAQNELALETMEAMSKEIEALRGQVEAFRVVKDCGHDDSETVSRTDETDEPSYSGTVSPLSSPMVVFEKYHDLDSLSHHRNISSGGGGVGGDAERDGGRGSRMSSVAADERMRDLEAENSELRQRLELLELQISDSKRPSLDLSDVSRLQDGLPGSPSPSLRPSTADTDANSADYCE